mgnify:CR=1 FL=1
MLLLVLLAVGGDSLRSDLGRARGPGERKELSVADVGRLGDREEKRREDGEPGEIGDGARIEESRIRFGFGTLAECRSPVQVTTKCQSRCQVPNRCWTSSEGLRDRASDVGTCFPLGVLVSPGLGDGDPQSVGRAQFRTKPKPGSRVECFAQQIRFSRLIEVQGPGCS